MASDPLLTFSLVLKRRHALWFEKESDASRQKMHSKKACQKRYTDVTEVSEPPCCPYWQRRLANKWNARLWASAHGARPPRLLWSGAAQQLSEISWETLPADFVIKPTSGWSCQGVLPLHRLPYTPVGDLASESSPPVTTASPEYRQLFTGEILTVSHIMQRLHAINESRPTTFLIEEMVSNEAGQPGIPTDYKCYLFGGHLHSILAIQRTGPHSGSAAVFDRHWKPLPSAEWLHKPPYPLPVTPIPRPHCLKEMVATAERLGEAYGTFVRVDLYATPEGPLFGEFTPFPNGAHGFNPSADRHLATWYALDATNATLQRILWKGYQPSLGLTTNRTVQLRSSKTLKAQRGETFSPRNHRQ